MYTYFCTCTCVFLYRNLRFEIILHTNTKQCTDANVGVHADVTSRFTSSMAMVPLARPQNNRSLLSSPAQNARLSTDSCRRKHHSSALQMNIQHCSALKINILHCSALQMNIPHCSALKHMHKHTPLPSAKREHKHISLLSVTK